MKPLFRLLCLTFLLALCLPALADTPYKPSDIQAALSQHDLATADREIQAVLVAAPNSAVAHYWDAKVLIEEHHAGQALVEVQKAQSLPAPKFKDPAKLAEFNANLAKASTDLQKTISDEETALAHPQTTTTTTKRLAPMHATAFASMPVRTGSTLVTHLLIALLGLLGIAILVISFILVKLVFFKPKVLIVTKQDNPDWGGSASRPVGNYAGGPSAAVSPPRYAPPPTRYASPSSAAGMSSGSTPVAAGHSTGAVVGAGLGGLAAGMLLEEALHDRNGGFGGNASGFGSSNFGGGGSEEIDTTTTTTTYDDAPVQQDYQQDDQDLSSSGTDDNFGSSDGGGSDFGGDSGGGGGDDSF
jgi:hypothetical protein